MERVTANEFGLKRNVLRENQLRKLDNFYKILIGFAIAAPVFFIVAIGFYFGRFHGGLSSDNAKWGTFGDFLGGTLNPLFSLLAFFALIYTIKLQSIELRNSAEQLEKSADALVKQNSYMDRQNFESTFFRLFELYQNTLAGLEATIWTTYEFDGNEHHKDEFLKGRDLIKSLYLKLNGDSALHPKSSAGEMDFDEKARFEARYEKFHVTYNYLIGHYFLTLYHLINYVDQASSLTDEEKKYYAKLVRAQLSKYEITLLFFNCISKYGRDGLSPLVKKYKLLKFIDRTTINNIKYWNALNEFGC